MVERLKAAIEKARELRVQQVGDVAAPAAATDRPAAPRTGDWSILPEATIDPATLDRNRVISYRRNDPSHLAFDILRTRLLKVCADNGWLRVGISSPSKGCGKTVVAANLSFSLSRHLSARAIALDFDLRAPNLGRRLGLRTEKRIADLLTGRISPEAFLERIGDRLAVAPNTVRERDSAELMQSPEVGEALDRLTRALSPTIMLFDLPPMLVGDDTIAALAQLDALLLVAAAGETTPDQIRECERLIASSVPLIGVVLNKCEQDDIESYQYGYEEK